MNSRTEQIKPETLAILEKQAKVFGLSVDDYLRSLLPKSEKELALKRGDVEFESDMIAFAEDSDSKNYNGTFSREDIYFDHD